MCGGCHAAWGQLHSSPAAVTMATCTLLRMSAMMWRIISLSCSMCAPSAYSVPSASNVMSRRPWAEECTCKTAQQRCCKAGGAHVAWSLHLPCLCNVQDVPDLGWGAGSGKERRASAAAGRYARYGKALATSRSSAQGTPVTHQNWAARTGAATMQRTRHTLGMHQPARERRRSRCFRTRVRQRR